MYCKNCGEKLDENAKFCPNCGENTKNESGVKTIKLRCKECSGIMEVDSEKQEVYCPYCGNKEMIADSDAVAVEKIRSKTYKDVEMAKMKQEKEKSESEDLKTEKQAYRKGKLSKVTIVFTFICLIAMFTSFSNGKILAGLVALVQTVVFAASWLMGMQIIEEKKKSIYIALAILGFLLIIPFSMARNIKKSEKLSWPTTGIATNIPKPSNKYGSIIINDDESFHASLDKVSSSDYEKYVVACKDMGYTIDGKTDSSGYEAFNSEGYKLDISFYDSLENMDIGLDAPIAAKEFKWPNSETAKQIPNPKSNVGKIEWENANGFVIYVSNTTKDDYAEYVEKCLDAGFTVDYCKGDTYYYADNADGYHLDLRYEGNDTMFVRLDAPDEKETTTEETTASETSEPAEETTKESKEKTETAAASETVGTSEELVDGMRPSFKEAMDSYEVFYDQYCEFMKSYDSSDLTMLAEYTKLLAKASDVDKKFEAWDETEMNDKETAYYLEVNNRVMQKLLAVSQ